MIFLIVGKESLIFKLFLSRKASGTCVFELAVTDLVSVFLIGKDSTGQNLFLRVAAGITTGGAAVLCAQPTDVVKVRMQAETRVGAARRYSGAIDAYKTIAKKEGVRGLWKGKEHFQ